MISRKNMLTVLTRNKLLHCTNNVSNLVNVQQEEFKTFTNDVSSVCVEFGKKALESFHKVL